MSQPVVIGGRVAVVAALGALGLVVNAGVQAGGRQATGTIAGVVTIDADQRPAPRMLQVTADPAVCGQEVEDRAAVVNAAGQVANAVVLVGGLPWGESPRPPVINNAGCYFVPRVQVAPTRSVVTLTSEDDVLHTTHAYDDRQRTLFNIAIPIPGLEIERPLRRPGPVRIECDSHGWMRGWVYVSDDRGATTGADGRFEVADVPPGTYELTVWHERFAGSPRTVTVTAGGTAEVAFRLE